eukprot:EG_transcript_8799
MGCVCLKAASYDSDSSHGSLRAHSLGAGQPYKLPPLSTELEPGGEALAVECDPQESVEPSSSQYTVCLTPSELSSNLSFRTPRASPRFTVLVPEKEDSSPPTPAEEPEADPDPDCRLPPRRQCSFGPRPSRPRPVSLTFKVRPDSPGGASPFPTSPSLPVRASSFRVQRSSPSTRGLPSAGTTLVLKSKPAGPFTPQPRSSQKQQKNLRRTKSMTAPKRQGWTVPASAANTIDL